ncbi:Eisosome component PIL1-domain-containing protein [Dichotomocladium elegans]|nr:Eisosome component PIL1-domain-containing protein [Dichotomocladium elegans]
MVSFNLFHTRSLSDGKSNAPEDKSFGPLLESERKMVKEWVKIADSHHTIANQLKLSCRPFGDAMADVGSKVGDMIEMASSIYSDVAGQSEQFRATMKTLGEKQALIASINDTTVRLQETIRKHEENHPGQVDKLMELKQQLVEHEEASLGPMTDASNFQRVAMREALYLFLNTMHEMASKIDIVASFGKYIVDELDVTPVQPGMTRPPYHGTEQTTRIVKDAKRAITNWHPDSATVRRTLTSHHHGQNPLVVVAPPATAAAPAPAEGKELPKLPTGSEPHSPIESAHSSGRSSPTTTTSSSSSFYSSQSVSSPAVYKPDEVTISSHSHPTASAAATSSYPPPPHLTPQPMPSADPASPPHYPGLGPGGFSPFVLEQQQQQHLYQFYQHYVPPRPYEDMASQQRQRHPSPQHSPFLGPGGFVLPTVNPNFALSSSPPRAPSPTRLPDPLTIPTPATAPADASSSPEPSPSSSAELHTKTQLSPA